MNVATTKKTGRPVDQERCERRQEEILDGAVQLFAECGYADADTQVLADRLGVGKGTIYRYFPSKRELFLAAADRAMRRMHEYIDRAITGIEDPLDRIARAIRAYLEFVAEHPEFVELLIQERAQFKERKKPTYWEHREANLERWHALYRDLMAEGRVRQVPVERITDVMSQLLYGTMFTNYFTGTRKPPDFQARDIVDIVFNGILSDAERRRRTAD
jgi:AcrR family transcriptional regulator